MSQDDSSESEDGQDAIDRLIQSVTSFSVGPGTTAFHSIGVAVVLASLQFLSHINSFGILADTSSVLTITGYYDTGQTSSQIAAHWAAQAAAQEAAQAAAQLEVQRAARAAAVQVLSNSILRREQSEHGTFVNNTEYAAGLRSYRKLIGTEEELSGLDPSQLLETFFPADGYAYDSEGYKKRNGTEFFKMGKVGVFLLFYMRDSAIKVVPSRIRLQLVLLVVTDLC